MTKVYNTKECLSRFKKEFEQGLFTQDDIVVLKLWALEMETYGPDYIKDSAEWRDHALDRKWIGYRASCFSVKGRIIYRIIDQKTVEICEVERITPDHDYKK